MSVGLGAMAAINFANGFLGGLKESKAYKEKASSYYQQAANYRQNAANIRMQGVIGEDAQRFKNRAALARTQALLSENGMAESPTALSSVATTLSDMEQNLFDRRYQNETRAQNSIYQAGLAENQARAAKKKSHNAFQSGLINGISSAFSVFS